MNKSLVFILLIFGTILSGCITSDVERVPIRQEYKVISVDHGEYFISGGEFYKVTYVDSNNEVKTITLDYSDVYHVYLSNSNESKFVVKDYGFGAYELFLSNEVELK